MTDQGPEEIDSSVVLANKYQIVGKIGSGSFGEIFLAKNMRSGEDVAVKVENHTIDKSTSGKTRVLKSQLKREAKIYANLFDEVGVPKLRWFGISQDRNWLVMDLLGRSLEDLFNFCGRKFSLKTVAVVACELICRIETIHNAGKLVHRDIKPDNFLMGRGRDRHTVFIIDFGLAKLFQNPRNGQHIPMKEGYSLTGTARYASINAHLGLELSRRDDLVSIGYVLVYFLKGSLPWQGLPAESHEDKYQRILEKKQSTSLEDLCEDLPGEFLDYFRHVTDLGFEDTPDYTHLKGLFRKVFTENKFTYDANLYDWEVIAAQRHPTRKSN